MKKKLMMIIMLIILLLPMAACSSQEVSVELSIDDFTSQNQLSKEVRVAAGDTIKMVLGSNMTTGFSWQPPVITDDAVVRQKGESGYIPPDEQIPGAGGKEVWYFEALKAGVSTVSMEYSQPWEGGEKAAWEFNLKVTVE
jgi:inhibitor of cysteine peptidase